MVKLNNFITSENEELLYPSSDGKRMAENTLQFEWIVKIKLNLERLTAGKNIFVAGDLLWYPVQGKGVNPKAADVMVAIGRPKGYRSSYMQWKEDNVSPQVAFEILSPSNDGEEMRKKLAFYNRYGVQEYYIYDPHENVFTVYHRAGKNLELQAVREYWQSPLLGIHFHWTAKILELSYPEGEPFITYLELSDSRQEAIEQARTERAARIEAEQKMEEMKEMLEEKDKIIASFKAQAEELERLKAKLKQYE